MFKKYLFCRYFVEYEIDVSFYFHKFFFGFKLCPPPSMNPGSVPAPISPMNAPIFNI